MASIEEIIRDADTHCDVVKRLQPRPDILSKVIEPLKQTGFSDFKFISKGSSSLIFAPVDNDKIVFRITTEDDYRRDDVPFFLASPYKHSVSLDAYDVKLEVLLAGKKITPDQKPAFLEEMKGAGWFQYTTRELSEHPLWNDVVTIQVRKDGRVKTVPIVSDPSAARFHLINAMPRASEINSCRPSYITMQDQADAYNKAINEDPRLKQLIPKSVQFPETTILATDKTAKLPPFP